MATVRDPLMQEYIEDTKKLMQVTSEYKDRWEKYRKALEESYNRLSDEEKAVVEGFGMAVDSWQQNDCDQSMHEAYRSMGLDTDYCTCPAVVCPYCYEQGKRGTIQG